MRHIPPFVVPRLLLSAPALFCFAASLGATDAVPANPLFTASSLPYQLPPFDQLRDEHFAPAFERGMTEQLAEVDAVARNPEAPTFANTIIPLERSGVLLTRVNNVFSNLSAANTNPAIQEVEAAMAPKLAAHRDAIRLNGPLFARIKAVYEKRDALDLDAESKRVVERYYRDFVRAGANLSDAEKNRLKAFNSEIAVLETNFAQNVLKEKNADSVVLEDRALLDGFTEAEVAAAADAAKEDGHPGKYVLRLLNTTGQPPLASLTNRAVREQLMQASLRRGSHGGAFDNRALVAKLVRLRAERAALLGFPNHAAYQLEEQTAKNIGNVNKLLADLAQPAVANARREAADMQALVDQAGGGFQIGAADWAFYSEKVRQARYNFDESKLKPYFELNRVLIDGVFYAATQLYGVTFKERHDLPVYHPDVRVFEVFDANGAPLALFLFDPFARPSKRGGAWMNEYVSQSGLFGLKPVVGNHHNIPKPQAGAPVLLTFDEVITAFHEFGHALHGMLSNVHYPRFSGTDVPRDFVEFPSQVNEMWATWPEVLKHYARHYQTGEPMPLELVDKVVATQKFNQGYATTEYLAASLLDQAWHQRPAAELPSAEQVVAFEADALRAAGVDFAPVPPRYRTTYFSHVFSSNDYSAGYYSYIWSEVLDADTVEWFKQNGGLKRENGDRFRQLLLSRGGSEDALDMFRKFIGRDPYVEPLLERRGLKAPAAP
ncbi:M3 family metallopeptidase [Opitutus terrae]|uniref:Dipeptidyl carboxypeptidase n=1 Tax=Opitutus terrae (strain DSM 11246 / JCM 15787 / PB90-1) TaxID=452637 RepID=B1ZUN6_OPITP|nr:M3 family metallopeptidase [Opitutus terrae]ACB74920.1 Peptidyl-dipeptidase Dcp [Opitutus terrae PB90-1]